MPWYNNAGSISGCVAAYDAIGAASQAASYVNAVTPGTFDLAPGTAPAWANGTGWTFTHTSSQYLVGGPTPASGWSMILRFAGPSTAGSQIAAGSVGAGETRLYVGPVWGSQIYGGGGFLIAGGVIGANTSIGVANQRCFLNGAFVSTTNAAWSGSGASVYVGAVNATGSPTLYYGGVIAALAIYNTTVSDADMAILHTNINLLPNYTEAAGKGLPVLQHWHAEMMAP